MLLSPDTQLFIFFPDIDRHHCNFYSCGGKYKKQLASATRLLAFHQLSFSMTGVSSVGACVASPESSVGAGNYC